MHKFEFIVSFQKNYGIRYVKLVKALLITFIPCIIAIGVFSTTPNLISPTGNEQLFFSANVVYKPMTT